MNSEYRTKLERAVADELKVVDEDGFIYWVDSFDDDGVYFHTDEGETQRASHSQFKSWMEFIDA